MRWNFLHLIMMRMKNPGRGGGGGGTDGGLSTVVNSFVTPLLNHFLFQLN